MKKSVGYYISANHISKSQKHTKMDDVAYNEIVGERDETLRDRLVATSQKVFDKFWIKSKLLIYKCFWCLILKKTTSALNESMKEYIERVDEAPCGPMLERWRSIGVSINTFFRNKKEFARICNEYSTITEEFHMFNPKEDKEVHYFFSQQICFESILYI